METTFKNLNQFKKGCQVGQRVKVINHLKGISEERLVTKVQSNALFTGHEITEDVYHESLNDFFRRGNVIKQDNKYFTLSSLPHQRAKHMRFDENKVSYLAYEENGVRQPSLDFNVGDTWLELVFLKGGK